MITQAAGRGAIADHIRAYLPGITIVAFGTLAALELSDRCGIPLNLVALLIGLSLSFLTSDERLAPGLRICSGTLLRAAIVMVGLRITLSQIVGLGPLALFSIGSIVVLTIISGVLASKWLNCGSAFGVLAGGAVGICGGSAAAAIFATLGDRNVNKNQLSVVLVGISCLSPAAMITYPMLARALNLGDVAAGFFLGASVHDVAQALGAGYSFSQRAGETAAIVKLGRVILLAPSLLVLSALFRLSAGKLSTSKRAPLLPWFVCGFLFLAGVNSLGLIPVFIENGASSLTPILLACAVTATGIQSQPQALREAGFAPIIVMLVATAVACIAALAASKLVA